MDQGTPFRVVVFRGETHWVAQFLEVDFAVQAATEDDLPEQIVNAILAEREYCKAKGITAFSGLPPAPERYWAMWNGAKPLGGAAPSVWDKLASWLPFGEVRTTVGALAAT